MWKHAGSPLLQAALASASAPTAGEAEGACLSRVWLPGDQLYALRLEPGTVMLVGVAMGDGTPAALLGIFASQWGVELVDPPPDQNQAGSYAVPAEVWPHPRLQPGMIAMSRGLQTSLANPAAGAAISLYSSPFCRAQPVCDSMQVRLLRCHPAGGGIATARGMVTPGSKRTNATGSNTRRKSPAVLSPSMRASASRPVAAAFAGGSNGKAAHEPEKQSPMAEELDGGVLFDTVFANGGGACVLLGMRYELHAACGIECRPRL